MKTRWKIYTLIFGLCLPLFTMGQVSRVENEAGYWSFGLNGGFSYQSSDIQATNQGFGFGATLGKNFYYRPGAALSFDLRGRLLFARQFGLDPLRSFDIQSNSALNGEFDLDYTNYPSQLNVNRGFVYQNHRTDVAELGLEGVFTFNRLRENTGIIASIYGGIGIDWYQTKIDQADASGNEYFNAYASLDESASKSKVRNELRNAILDANYESLADDFKDYGKLGIMPSLGFELGYEVTPNFSIFAGHRLTFSGTDLLDGHQWEAANKDIYHYTNFGLRWKIHPYRQRQIVEAPEIDVTRPYTDPYRTQDPKDGFVRADIRNVQSQSDVECRLNGREIPFNYSYGTFETNFPLQPGRNEIQIFARNSAGSANKIVVILLEEIIDPPRVSNTPPSIVITNPPYPEYRTNEDNFTIQAVIEKIRSSDAVTFYLNGQNHRFNFNIANGTFSANIPLREGRNDIRIVARNESGEREETSSLIKSTVVRPPSVDIREPAADNIETNNNTARILANTSRVERKDQITFSINGRQNSNFRFDANSGQIDASVSLQQGNNRVEIVVKTIDGTASDQVNIAFREPQPQRPRPIVNIEVPSQQRVSTTYSSGDVQARIQHVDSKRNITFQINGQSTNNFEYNNGLVRASVPLRQGENEIRITVNNESGNASDVVYILRESEVIQSNPPSVSISYPRDREETDQANIDFRANTRNILRKGDVTLLINNRRSYSFSYNNFNGEVSASIPLNPGQNNIVIQVSNTDGRDEDRIYVVYRQPDPPTVSITSPREGFRSKESTITVKAIAQRIARSNQIGFFVNGNRITRFDFSGARGEINANVTLRAGQNTIRITAENADGRAEDQVNVFYDQQPVPIVRINRPADNSTTQNSQVSLEANVQNINGQHDIVVSLNGQKINDFRYNNATKSLTADVKLREGNNTIKVQAVNTAGRDEASVHITYAPLRAPTVSITDPASANAQSTESNYTIRAKTTQVTQRNDISVTVNGQNDNRFSWNAETGLLSLQTELQDGENRIRIQVRNTAGQDQAEAIISYLAPQLPEVSIEQPGDQQKFTVDRVMVRAKVTNVNTKRDVIFKVNGSYNTNFTLNGEILSVELTGLKEGTNRVSITANNRFGKDFDERTIIYEPIKIAPPKVNIISVSTPVIDFNNPGYGLVKVVAKIENVDQQELISLTVNGQKVTNFTFRPAQQNLEADLLLEKGKTNVILIEASNEAGTARDRKEVSF